MGSKKKFVRINHGGRLTEMQAHATGLARVAVDKLLSQFVDTKSGTTTYNIVATLCVRAVAVILVSAMLRKLPLTETSSSTLVHGLAGYAILILVLQLRRKRRALVTP